MALIQPGKSEDGMEFHSLTIENPDLSLKEAGDLARRKARSLSADAMMLSWFNGKTGAFFPDHDCGGSNDPPWRVFAESRGGNLTIDINQGEYVFIFLKI